MVYSKKLFQVIVYERRDVVPSNVSTFLKEINLLIAYYIKALVKFYQRFSASQPA